MTEPPAAPGDGPAVRVAGPAGDRLAGGPGAPRTPRSPPPPRGYAGSRPPPSLAELDAAVSVCRACPRLVRWREDVAAAKRASFADQPYWGRPIAGWGSADAARS